MILPIYLLAKAPLISRLALIGFLTRLLRFSLVKDPKLIQKGVRIDCLGARCPVNRTAWVGQCPGCETEGWGALGTSEAPES